MYVTLKPSILDPQGKTIAQALQTMGYQSVQDVRQGQVLRAGSRRELR